MTEKPVMMILPTWDPDEPRFIVKECPQCSDDRVFKNNKCVYNQRLGFAYSVDEIVEVLNNENDETNNCENCHHYDSLLDFYEGAFHRCLLRNKMWEKCNDYDAIKED